jgi:hypothetical protein
MEKDCSAHDARRREPTGPRQLSATVIDPVPVLTWMTCLDLADRGTFTVTDPISALAITLYRPVTGT